MSGAAGRILLFWLLSLSIANAQSWETNTQEIIPGKLSGVYGPLALFSHNNVSKLVSVETLSDASLLRLPYLADEGATTTSTWATPAGQVTKALKGKLQTWNGKKLVNFTPGDRTEPKFYLIYYGAFWCPPCRSFSPRLLEAYRSLKAAHGDDFEVIFVSSDNDTGEQVKYVAELGMPWPIVKLQATESISILNRWKARGIPNLVAVTANGDLLYHSYVGTEYVGPNEVVKKFTEFSGYTRLDPWSRPQPWAHRLAVLRAIKAAGSQSVPPASYLHPYERKDFHGIESKQITLSLVIDERGKVTDVDTVTPIPAVHRAAVLKVVEGWLFIPAIENGTPRSVRVNLPLAL